MAGRKASNQVKWSEKYPPYALNHAGLLEPAWAKDEMNSRIREDIMGDWGVAPWDNDEAADWFQKFWKGGGISLLIHDIQDFDEKEERYDSIRAAAYLLEVLGIVYVWPTEHSDKLKGVLERTISILEKMINPPNDDWGFMDMWGGNQQVAAAVRQQIITLKMRLKDLP